ncbi:hypothetical protein DOT_5666 [Desulfosporosinus sp. OT]|nr:hypothetical protein DOT_5666 [Desulfosporosinus sp. OT]
MLHGALLANVGSAWHERSFFGQVDFLDVHLFLTPSNF